MTGMLQMPLASVGTISGVGISSSDLLGNGGCFCFRGRPLSFGGAGFGLGLNNDVIIPPFMGVGDAFFACALMTILEIGDGRSAI